MNHNLAPARIHLTIAFFSGMVDTNAGSCCIYCACIQSGRGGDFCEGCPLVYDLQSSDTVEQLENISRLLRGFFYRCRNDAQFTCLFLTSGFEQITGYSAPDFVGPRGRQFALLAAAEDQDLIRSTVEAALKNNMPWELDYRLITRTGKAAWVHEHGSGVYSDEGELLFLEGAIIDISEQKRSELRLRAYLASSSELSSRLMVLLDSVLSKLSALDLLSLNARIEAGRADNSSAGFGVVATEIKRLSDSTKEDTNLLRGLVNELNAAGRPGYGDEPDPASAH